jgi:tetratricopeptide (TPR) repeat protein
LRLTRILVLVACAAGIIPSRAAPAAPLHRFAPAPAWVLPATADYDAPEPKGQLANGTWPLLLDRQVNVTATGDEYYVRYVQKAVNQAGLQGMGQVDLYVDPRYQGLTINAIQVVRQGKVMDAAPAARFTELPVENELDRLIYRGLYKVNVVLADLRVGDVVDFAYTLRSQEKFFPGQFATRMQLGWGEPLHWQRVRLRYPATRPLQVRFNRPGLAVNPVTSGEVTEFSYVSQDAKPVLDEAGRPSWYEPWAVMEVSDFPEWRDVAGRFSTLFKLGARPRPRLNALVAELDKGPPGAEERISQALQYVQDNIRYTSIAIDRGAFKPSDPEVVLERRFGDCKDKALLLSTILRRYGIDATPALVNTYRGRALPLGLPSAWAFDHAIVRVRAAGGEYWVDPTSFRQQTPLRELSPPDFAQSLVLAPETTGLATIPRPSSSAARVDALVELDLRNGQHQPATMKLEFVYYDNRADLKRAMFAAQSLEAWQAGLTPHLERFYPGLRARGLPELEDDPARNRLSVTAHFEIDQVFHPAGKRWEFAIHEEWLYPFLEPLRAIARTTPLALAYPAHVHQRTSVLLPAPWTLDRSDLRVENPAFTYTASDRYGAFKLELDREFTTLKDSVEVTELPRFQQDLKKVDAHSPFLMWTTVAPVDAAALTDPKALRKLILQTDASVRKDSDLSSVANTMASVLGAPAFASLSSEDRHTAYVLDADMAFAVGLGNGARAYRSIRAATELPEANARDWEYRARGAHNTGDRLGAAQALTEVARRLPERIGGLSKDIQSILDGIADQPQAWFDLAETLSHSRWAASGRAHAFAPTWRRLAAIWVQRADTRRAREVLELIDDPYELIQARADRRFDAVFADPAAVPDISKVVSGRLERLREEARRQGSLEILNERLMLLLEGQEYDEVLELSGEALDRAARAEPGVYYPAHVRWVRDHRARALWAMNRRDDALQQWSLAIASDRGEGTAQATNLGVAYCHLDRPRDALRAIEAIEGSDTVQRMALSEVRLCASIGLKDTTSADAALTYLRDHRTDKPRLYQRALIWSNRLDEAAAFLRDRLADPDTRGHALVDVQDYAQVPVFSRSPEFTARWQQVLKREDVRSAIKAVGTVERYPFGPPLE